MSDDTTITYEDEDGRTSITVKGGCGDLEEVFERLIVPVLLGAGFSKGAIDRVMGNAE
jgi:hypothetical protein